MTYLQTFTESIPSMSTKLDITILYDKAKTSEAHQLIQIGFAEANRLIGIISAWQEGTELYKVNQKAGIQPVKVCDELFYLLKRSLKISEMTGGLFDVTFASIDKVWYFDRPMTAKPSHEEIANSVRNINYKYIELDEKQKTVFVKNKGTKIELGAIGKGYIANKIKLILQAQGVQSGLVNAGGDLVCWGTKENGEPWKVGITDPNNKADYLAWLPLHNQAVATSGSYERFAIIDGVKYSHILHPRTGYPVSGLQSVTIISADAELCDSVATSIFLLGKTDGMAFINQYDDIQCFMIDDENNYHFSENLKQKNYVQTA
jgi:thiamine biosynthesis lipoprotein